VSRENVAVVRKPLQVRDGSSRTLDQRFALRFPPLASASARLFGKLPPTSRIRQALLSRTVRLKAEAFNRRDFKALLLSYHPQAEFRAPRVLAESNILQTSYRGKTATSSSSANGSARGATTACGPRSSLTPATASWSSTRS
jgi:hypothetical protein